VDCKDFFDFSLPKSTPAPKAFGAAPTMLFEAHEPLLNRALEALRTREYWSPFPENPSPKVYGEGAQADGKRAITDLLSRDFPLRQKNEADRHAGERFPRSWSRSRKPRCAARPCCRST
jgi:hypothetical protein